MTYLRTLSAATALSLLVLFGCDSATSLKAEPEPIPFRSYYNQLLSMEGPATLVFRTAQEWKSFTDEHWHVIGAEAPTFDFEQEMLIGIFYKNHTGCSNGDVDVVEEVLRTDSYIEVRIGELFIRPEDPICATELPVHQIIFIESSPLEVRFTGEVPE